MSEKIICFDARKMNAGSSLMQLVCSVDYKYVLADAAQMAELNLPRHLNVFVEMDQFNEVESENNVIILSQNLDTLQKAEELGYQTALYCSITNEEEMENAWKNGGNFSFLFVEFADETNIPLELLLARLQSKHTNVVKFVKTAEDAIIAMKVMEKGSDGVVLSNTDSEEILKLEKYYRDTKRKKINLVEAEVTNVEHIEMGFRACIDTTSIMTEKEGMLIGSTSRGGILVSSETHYLPYMTTRPFRVNAGAVHSYIFREDEETNYLSELKAGSTVMVSDTEGNTRQVSVGRMKIEQRPLLKIEAKADNVAVNVIVQDDWHIRIFGKDGAVLNASSIKPGDTVLAYLCDAGRHVGIKIDENLIEV